MKFKASFKLNVAGNDFGDYLALKTIISENLISDWELFAELKLEKQWVYGNYKLIKKLDSEWSDNKKKAFVDIYKNIKLPSSQHRDGFPKCKAEMEFELIWESGIDSTFTVNYNEFGFPEFEKYAPQPESTFTYSGGTTLNGGNTDFKDANECLAGRLGFVKDGNDNWVTDNDGFLRNEFYEWNPSVRNFYLWNDEQNDWVKYTWHHFQDGVRMFPVPSRIHSPGEPGHCGFNQTGGEAIIKKVYPKDSKTSYSFKLTFTDLLPFNGPIY